MKRKFNQPATMNKLKESVKEFAIYFGGAIVLIGGITGLFVLLFRWGTPKENRVKYDTSVLEVCMNPELSAEFTLSLVMNSKIAVGYAGRTEVHEWQAALPESRIPEGTSDVDIVICVDENRDVLDTCNYTGGTSYQIQRSNPEIYVFHEESRVGFSGANFKGELPRFDECPLTFTNSDFFDGGLPTEDFVDWVEENIP